MDKSSAEEYHQAAMFETVVTVSMADTDPAGVMFFARVYAWMHVTYEELLAEGGMPLSSILADGKIGIPIVHSEADYRKPICLGERLKVRIHDIDVGHKSFSLTYRILGADGSARVDAKTIHGVIDLESGKSIALPPPLRQLLQDVTE